MVDGGWMDIYLYGWNINEDLNGGCIDIESGQIYTAY